MEDLMAKNAFHITKVLVKLDSLKPTDFLISPRGNRPFERWQERDPRMQC